MTRLVASRYRLGEPLGTGGMGRVWLARDEMLRRDVAIKELVLPHGLSTEERAELRLRTLREARAAARLSHPNVIQIYDVIQSEDEPWIVMEYVRSRSLYEVVRRDGPLSPKAAAEVALAILAALVAAHRAGVLHRDVKPGNVLLADDGRVVLTDFGLAAFESGEGSVTRPGLVLGSPQYVAPERARDGVSTPEADLWSLGATLYAAVEGHAPYARTTAMATLTALATEQLEPPHRAGPLRPVLDGLLRKNPRTRMTAPEAEKLLRRVVAGDGRARRRVPRARRPESASGAKTVELAGAAAVVEAASGGTTLVGSGLRRTRRWLIVAAVAAVVLGFPTVVLLANIRLDDRRAPAAGPASGAWQPASQPAGGGVGGTGAGPGAPDCPPVASSPVPRPTSTRTRAFAPLAGWVWYDDPAGFSILVPGTWAYARAGSLVCFLEPGGGRVLAVDLLGQAVTSPSAYWSERERLVRASGRPNNYQLVDLRRVDYRLGGAEWEYAFDGTDGSRMHAVARAFLVAPGQAYAIYWVTSEFDWPLNLENYRFVAPSFTPLPR